MINTMLRWVRMVAVVCALFAHTAAAETPAATPVAAQSAAPATYLLSRDHVNLVRVSSDRITDVVFDTEALEVSADKERGIVFVRVRRNWLQANPTPVTSAYFNTRTENHAVRLVVSSVPSQTIDLPRNQTVNAEQLAIEERLAALERPLMRFAASDYIAELKALVRQAAHEKPKTPAAGEVGRAFARASAQTVSYLPIAQEPVSWQGLRVRMTQAFVTNDKLCEAFTATNFTASQAKLDLAHLAREVPGVLAVACEKTSLAPAESTAVVLIRSRQAAMDADRDRALRTAVEALQDDDDRATK